MQAPGDTLAASAAIRSLHLTYPGQYAVSVEGTAAEAIFHGNPDVTTFNDPDIVCRMDSPLVHQSHIPTSTLMGNFCHVLGKALGIDLELKVSRPILELSEQEKGWTPRIQELTGRKAKYWVVCLPGRKTDYTTKRWPVEYMQEVVDRLQGRIQFVQVGEAGHEHKPLRGVIDEIGQTDTRQLIRLCYHAEGVVTGDSFPHWIGGAFGKPTVTIASGVVPVSWIWLPSCRILTRQGGLSCCALGACWKAKVKDCLQTVHTFAETIPRCMAMIEPAEVVQAIEDFYIGGRLTY